MYVRRRPRVRLDPPQSGGGQERGMRSGTVPTPLVVGLGAACELAQEEMEVCLFIISYSCPVGCGQEYINLHLCAEGNSPPPHSKGATCLLSKCQPFELSCRLKPCLQN